MWKILFLIFIANLLLLFFSYSSQNPWNEVYFNSNTEKLSSNSHTNFNFSSTNITIMDVYESGYLIANTDLCPELGKNMKLMILVTSALPHSEARIAIRQTWGFYARHHNVGVGFILGSYKELSENTIVQKEQRTYGDLIQARLVDSYNNLTLKTVSVLEWVDSYCSQVPFVLKTDDDMFINIPLLLELLEKLRQPKRCIFGQLAQKWTPSRVVDSKYFLSTSEYEPDTFPDFLTGPAYLMTQDSVHDLHHRALNMPFLKLEDVFTTGLAAASIGIRLINVNRFHCGGSPIKIEKIRDAISIHNIRPTGQFLLWAYTTNEWIATNKSSGAT